MAGAPARDETPMMASFLILILLGVAAVASWIAWWLMADLFGG
jgi:hypothetical protein